MVREGMGAEELLKMVREMIGSDMSEEKLWYSLKYDREMLVAVEGDNHVQVIFKGNNEHACIRERWSGEATTCEGCCVRIKRVRDIGEGKQIARSGGKCNDGEEVGEERGNNKAGVKQYDFVKMSLGVEGGELPASRLRLGGDTIEMSDDDEISVASEDVGDEEATKEDDVGDEQAAEKQCGHGNKRKGCADGNDVNDNVWPCSGMEARSYHRKLSIWKKFQDFVYVVCPTDLQFTVYPRPAAEIFPYSLAHTHCASIEYHGRHYAKPECTRSCAQHSNNVKFTSVFPIAIPRTYVRTTPPDIFGTHTVT
ncbi:LOW QUALITY PROTEIN: hypothetical protein Cgig2_020393 [Carnegiea gigantea]|uniref:Uncharacterized protein n=1 Tax=Carnegiea gigantea TaxID=171969 RepID=A0A9Q1K5T8_9CARY|nr:LOW QUALITY PROTEIN: hypothetical protein Cgig2_020393 [Carnegiea gigantea]